MGVGAPEDIVEGVARGIDIFDCVLPTRVARNGGLFTRHGRLNLRNSQYAADPLPIEPGCDCYTCQHFSRAYLRHLFKAGEILGLHLATVHNVRFILRLMAEIRAQIDAGTFAAFREQFLNEYQLNRSGCSPRSTRRPQGPAPGHCITRSCNLWRSCVPSFWVSCKG